MLRILREFIRIVKSSFTPGSSADTPRADRAREQRDNQARLNNDRKLGEYILCRRGLSLRGLANDGQFKLFEKHFLQLLR